MRRVTRLLAIALLIGAIAVPATGCARDVAEEQPPPAVEPVEPVAPAEPTAPTSPAEPSDIAWIETELVDVASGETFRISDFRGKPVLVKSFAVW